EKQKAKNLFLTAQAQELAKKISNFSLSFTLNKDEKDKAFGSVSSKEILDRLAEAGMVNTDPNRSLGIRVQQMLDSYPETKQRQWKCCGNSYDASQIMNHLNSDQCLKSKENEVGYEYKCSCLVEKFIKEQNISRVELITETRMIFEYNNSKRKNEVLVNSTNLELVRDYYRDKYQKEVIAKQEEEQKKINRLRDENIFAPTAIYFIKKHSKKLKKEQPKNLKEEIQNKFKLWRLNMGLSTLKRFGLLTIAGTLIKLLGKAFDEKFIANFCYVIPLAFAFDKEKPQKSFKETFHALLDNDSFIHYSDKIHNEGDTNLGGIEEAAGVGMGTTVGAYVGLVVGEIVTLGAGGPLGVPPGMGIGGVVELIENGEKEEIRNQNQKTYPLKKNTVYNFHFNDFSSVRIEEIRNIKTTSRNSLRSLQTSNFANLREENITLRERITQLEERLTHQEEQMAQILQNINKF
ncbi:10828_t:CDS:2, partial [Cetraspora pellucida]